VSRVKFMHTKPSEVQKTFGGRVIATEIIAPCGGLGYEYDHRPKLGERSDAKHVTNPSPAVNGQPVQCLSCGEPIGPNSCEPEGGWAKDEEPTPEAAKA
jgi:hypothetical protein